MLAINAKLDQEKISELETCAKWVRQQVLQMISSAGKGHIGGSFSCADILVYLYCSGRLSLNAQNPQLPERDRIIFSKGHSAEAYYASLARAGFINPEILKTYGKNGSPLGGHVDRSIPGVEYSSGSLGHGLGVACGMALAAREQKHSFVTLPILGDGECYEGSIWEAAMVAAQQRLSNIVAIVDRNGEITLDKTEDCNRLEPFADKWRAFGWEVREADGHSFSELHAALFDIHSRVSDKPLVILAHTVKGKGVSFMEQQVGWHHKVPKDAELKQARLELGLAEGAGSGFDSANLTAEGDRARPIIPRSAIGYERRPGMAAAGADVGAAQGCAARIERRGLIEATEPPQVDIRDALFDQLVVAAEKDPNIFVISCDQGALGFSRLREKYPSRCFNLGISEQTAIDMAAGLALQGMKPFVYAITNFVSLRCFEQISVNLGAMKLPVVLIASGAGLTYSSDGPTHHSLQDIALMRTIPYMQIFNPSDAATTAAAMQSALTSDKPCYIRLEKGVWPGFNLNKADLTCGYRTIRTGGKVGIVSTGVMTHCAVKVSELLEKKGIRSTLLDVFRIKPLANSDLYNSCKELKAVVVIEENAPAGALGDLLCSAFACSGSKLPFLHFSMPDEPCYFYGSRDWIHSQYGLDPASLAEKIGSWLAELT